MKTTLALAAILLGAPLSLSFPHALQAQTLAPPVPAGVRQMADFTYLVWASNPAAQRGQLQLVDTQNGGILYQQSSAAVSFGQKFNVRSLPDGHYAFIVKLGPRQYRYALTLRTTTQRSSTLQADSIQPSRRLAAFYHPPTIINPRVQ
jgi:hypothetical protein